MTHEKVNVLSIERRGPHLVADLRLEVDSRTTIRLRGVRAHRAGDRYMVVMPGVRRADGNYDPAIEFPRPWREDIARAVVLAARRRGLIEGDPEYGDEPEWPANRTLAATGANAPAAAETAVGGGAV